MKHILLVLAVAHCSNLARNSMGSSFKTSETKATASSESTQEGSGVSSMLERVKKAIPHTPVRSDKFLIYK